MKQVLFIAALFAATSTTFTLAANKAMIIQQDGGSTNYIISIY